MGEIILNAEENVIFEKALKKIEESKKNGDSSLYLNCIGITDNILTKLLPNINKLTELNLYDNNLTDLSENI